MQMLDMEGKQADWKALCPGLYFQYVAERAGLPQRIIIHTHILGIFHNFKVVLFNFQNIPILLMLIVLH